MSRTADASLRPFLVGVALIAGVLGTVASEGDGAFGGDFIDEEFPEPVEVRRSLRVELAPHEVKTALLAVDIEPGIATSADVSLVPLLDFSGTNQPQQQQRVLYSIHDAEGAFLDDFPAPLDAEVVDQGGFAGLESSSSLAWGRSLLSFDNCGGGGCPVHALFVVRVERLDEGSPPLPLLLTAFLATDAFDTGVTMQLTALGP